MSKINIDAFSVISAVVMFAAGFRFLKEGIKR